MKSKVEILVLAMVMLCSSSAIGENTILFHGLYQKEKNEKGNYGYLRFYEDGTVLGVMSSPEQVDEMAQWFTKDQPNPIGRYSIEGPRIKFTTMLRTFGVTRAAWDHEGEIKGETLTIVTTYNKIQSKGVYKFIPFTKPVETERGNSSQGNQEYEVIQALPGTLVNQEGVDVREVVKTIGAGDRLLYIKEEKIKVMQRQRYPGVNQEAIRYEDMMFYEFKVIYINNQYNERNFWPKIDDIINVPEYYVKERMKKMK